MVNVRFIIDSQTRVAVHSESFWSISLEKIKKKIKKKQKKEEKGETKGRRNKKVTNVSEAIFETLSRVSGINIRSLASEHAETLRIRNRVRSGFVDCRTTELANNTEKSQCYGQIGDCVESSSKNVGRMAGYDPRESPEGGTTGLGVSRITKVYLRCKSISARIGTHDWDYKQASYIKKKTKKKTT